MRVDLDQFAYLDSPLHRWEPRRKLIGLLALAFAFAFVRDLRLLPAMALVTFILFILSHLPFSFLVKRLSYPLVFFLVLSILLPFVSGSTVLWQMGPIAIRQEGLLSVVLILTRFVCILTVAIVLFGTAPLLQTIKAMLALGLPAILADMTLLAYRYIYELADYLERAQRATRLRGFSHHQLNRRMPNTLASLAGSLLVRSYERSERIYHAMILRGYGQAPRVSDEFPARPVDTICLAGVLLLAAAFVAGEMYLRGWGGSSRATDKCLHRGLAQSTHSESKD